MSEQELNWVQRLGQSGHKLTTAQRYYERGLDHFTNGRWPAALADLDEALVHEPDNAEYYITRGLILLQMGEDGEAEDDFIYGLGLDPTQWAAHYGRGMRAYKNAEYQAAINQFSRAQHVAPERPEIYFHRAICFFKMANATEAIRDMEFAQRLLDPDDKRHDQAKKWIDLFKTTQT
ncbi:MAG: tetratricopeptide repeat protein [Anaerolineae bacterium]|nr:tetratricopeptide repeat protein [Anaerolineae bacterium]